ncbi:MAG: hypothetical protein K2H64_12830 [Desulfovibrio sp.]|nr:hypothetical protein [Desulfovibrio sp.]
MDGSPLTLRKNTVARQWDGKILEFIERLDNGKKFSYIAEVVWAEQELSRSAF